MNPNNPESFTGVSGGAFRPEGLTPKPEYEPSKPNQAETSPAPQEVKQPSQATTLSLPILPAPQISDPRDQNDNGVPLVASDDDLIEKEWVQKAKNIVTKTKNDPYAQESEISKLQADYIKKRYGKEIKLAGDS